MADVVIIDALTGEVTERDFTPEELEQREADIAAAVEAEEARQSAEQAKADAKAAALAKLIALGLTEAEALALAGG